ncbi:MAG: hypothetical protein ACXABY_15725, partial [Candidatus Thorarchaeota archaeon]
MKHAKSRSKPCQILTRALLLGLAATVYLTKARVTKATRHLYEGGKGCKGIRKIYDEGLEEYYELKRERRPSADPLQRREGSIVRSFNKMTYNSAVPYGNTEVKRKRRREDRRYINTLQDHYGAGLRDLGAERFPFPPPMKTYTDNGRVKWVYPGNARVPEYSPTHTAPELDFVDMIRTHGTELVRQCLKYSVPMREARRHLDTLIVKLTPYLEAVYTGKRKIEDGFVRGGAKVVQSITTEIGTTYGGVTGYRQSITQEVAETIKLEGNESAQTINDDELEVKNIGEESKLKSPYDSFFSDLADECDMQSYSKWKKRVKKLREHTRGKLLGRNDVKHIEEDLVEHARQQGVVFHDFISNSEFTARPFYLWSVYKFGDEMINVPTEFLFVCEAPVADG